VAVALALLAKGLFPPREAATDAPSRPSCYEENEMPLDDKIRETLARVAKAPIPADRETSLFDTGVIDSFDLVDFVADLEKEFKITVPDNDLHPSKFESLGKIATYLSSRGAA
jgi:acyl carrier protein